MKYIVSWYDTFLGQRYYAMTNTLKELREIKEHVTWLGCPENIEDVMVYERRRDLE